MSLFANDMILYVKNSKDSTKKLLETINKYSEVTGHKINAQKSTAFLYTNNEMSEKEMEKTTPFEISTKKKNKQNPRYKLNKGCKGPMY